MKKMNKIFSIILIVSMLFSFTPSSANKITTALGEYVIFCSYLTVLMAVAGISTGIVGATKSSKKNDSLKKKSLKVKEENPKKNNLSSSLRKTSPAKSL